MQYYINWKANGLYCKAMNMGKTANSFNLEHKIREIIKRGGFDILVRPREKGEKE